MFPISSACHNDSIIKHSQPGAKHGILSKALEVEKGRMGIQKKPGKAASAAPFPFESILNLEELASCCTLLQRLDSILKACCQYL